MNQVWCGQYTGQLGNAWYSDCYPNCSLFSLRQCCFYGGAKGRICSIKYLISSLEVIFPGPWALSPRDRASFMSVPLHRVSRSEVFTVGLIVCCSSFDLLNDSVFEHVFCKPVHLGQWSICMRKERGTRHVHLSLFLAAPFAQHWRVSVRAQSSRGLMYELCRLHHNYHTLSGVEDNTHFYPAVSVCQESGQCPTGSSVWGLARLHARLAGCVLIRGLDGGRICFSAPSDCWLNSFPCESRVYFHLFL